MLTNPEIQEVLDEAMQFILNCMNTVSKEEIFDFLTNNGEDMIEKLITTSNSLGTS